MKSYGEAIEIFCKIICIWPESPASIRMGLGLCYFKLGQDAFALKCFERVLEMDPSNMDALTCIAVIQLNSAAALADDTLAKEGLDNLKKIYMKDKSNPEALLHLGKHFLEKAEYTKAEALLFTMFYNVTSTGAQFSGRLKAEAAFLLGKLYHVQCNFEDAYRYYLHATKYDESFYPAHFCLAQVLIERNDVASAISRLELLIAKFPDNFDVLKMLSALYLHVGDEKKSLSILSELVAKHPNDLDILSTYVTLIEQSQHEEALKLYLRIVDIFKKSEAEIPVEILNNLAVLLLDSNKVADALVLLKEALAVASNDAQAKKILLFNLGRCHESSLEYVLALDCYNEVLLLDPKYKDARLRIGMIYMKQGKGVEATDLFKDILADAQDCREAWLLLAECQLAVKAITPARKSFERVLTTIDRHDQYSLLSIGNIYMNLARYDILKHASPESLKKNINMALDFYSNSFAMQNKNYYAINGMSILTAFKGNFVVAREGFLFVRQVAPDFMDVWINLGHTYMQDGNYTTALSIYEHVDKRSFDSTLQLTALYTYMSKALYHIGKQTNQAAPFARAIEYLQKALLLQPSDHAIRFNLALCQQEYAVSVLATNISTRTFSDVLQAIDYLEVSVLFFEMLQELPQGKGIPPLPFDQKLARSRSKYCHSLKAQALAQYQKQREDELQREALLARKRQERQAADEQLEEEKRLEEERQRKEREELEQVYLRTQQKGLEMFNVTTTTTTTGKDEPSDAEPSGIETRKKRRGRPSRKAAILEEDSDAGPSGRLTASRDSLVEQVAEMGVQETQPTLDNNHLGVIDHANAKDDGQQDETLFDTRVNMESTSTTMKEMEVTRMMALEDESIETRTSYSAGQPETLDPIESYMNFQEDPKGSS